MSYATGCHTVFHHRYHIVWVTKYRYKVLEGTFPLFVRATLVVEGDDILGRSRHVGDDEADTRIKFAFGTPGLRPPNLGCPLGAPITTGYHFNNHAPLI